MVHRESGVVTLESFARCPKCGRNDRVEKVSAIYNYKSGSEVLISKLAPPQRSDYVNLRIEQIPDLILPQRPKPERIREKPNQKKEIIFFDLLFLIVILILSIAILINPTQEYKGYVIFAVIVIATIIAFFLNIPNNIYELIQIHKIRNNYEGYKRDLRNNNALAMEKWKQECEHAEELYEKEKELIKKENKRKKAINLANQLQYSNSKKRWEELYYCYRDDSVFVPGEGTYAPVEKLDEYLTQGVKK